MRLIWRHILLAGTKTLLVDIDPQGNASSVLAPDYDGPSPFAQAHPVNTHIPDLAILPAGNDLLGQEQRLNQMPGSRDHLKRHLEPISAGFDLVPIDCPPNLTVLPANGLIASNSILIPIQCEYYAMEGLGQIISYLEQLIDSDGHELDMLGIILTMYDQHSFSAQVAEEVRKHFGDLVFAQVIPRDVALAAAPSHSQTIIDHAPLSEGSLAYLSSLKRFSNDSNRECQHE